VAGPEDKARETIDDLLRRADWHVVDPGDVNLSAFRGTAIRNFTLKPGHGFADYLLYLDGKAAGVIEAKKEGTTLIGVERQSEKYTVGLPDGLPAWDNPLPFAYESTGVETRFTSGLDPDPRSRQVFAFHRPETLAESLGISYEQAAEAAPEYVKRGKTFLARVQQMPPLVEEGLWPAQITAIKNLEASLGQNRPRALIQMATGSGKTFTAISFIYRLIKFAGARRVLFLVDRGNLGDQTLKEFQQYVSPYNNFKFTEEFIVQRLSSNTLDKTARVCISTIQRLYSMLKGQEISEEDDETSAQGLEYVYKEVPPIEYNPAIPIETFDIIVTDECHRSIYNLWRQVLEYFDAHIIGLTATPGKQTFGFFNQNLVMEYNHEQAVADGVNVNYDVYRIKTEITDRGSKIEAGYYVDKRDRATRKVRWEQLSDDFEYDRNQLDRDVVAVDQIRTIIRTFRDKLFTEIFTTDITGRTEVPKTLIFAKDDSHADDIVQIVREEFGKGNEFAQKITYRTTGDTPQNLIKAFRNSYFPRIAVTVDMIATGTDIKPLEIVMFMRAVRSRTFFEQMKGRGVRIIGEEDLKAVTPDAESKDRFIIVDTLGVCERDMTDSRPMDRKKSVAFDKLLQAIALGNTEVDVASSVAVRIARLTKRIAPADQAKIQTFAGGKSLQQLAGDLVRAVDPDRHIERAKQDNPLVTEPSEKEVSQAASKLIQEAVRPLHNPDLRNLLVDLKKKDEQVIDTVSQDKVIEGETGFSEAARERAKTVVESFEKFIENHKDEITALQILYSRPRKQRPTFDNIKELAERIQAPPHLWTESQLWQAYAALERSKVRGASTKRILTDLVSLVRFAIHQVNELIPFPERVNANFRAWLASQESRGKKFTEEQRRWLAMIRDHIAANLGIEPDDFEYAPFSQHGGLGKVHQLFGDRLKGIIEELNETLAA
jgi:type I restriction enzyme R subunit